MGWEIDVERFYKREHSKKKNEKKNHVMSAKMQIIEKNKILGDRNYNHQILCGA